MGVVSFAKRLSGKRSTRSRRGAGDERVHAMEGGVRFLCTGEKLGLHPERHRGPSESSLATLARGEDWDAGHGLDGRSGHANVEMDLGRAMRRVSSAPTLKNLGSTSGGAGHPRANVGSEMEVYVVHRPLREFGGPAFQTLPDFVKHTLRDLGICHYMTIFRTPDGEMRQFDFGPIGGDISLKGKLPGHKRRIREKRGAQGEIREDVIDVSSLPEDCMFVGRTRLTLDDIRTFNQVQNSVYLLNQNDCRHYCNNLVKYSTGLEKVTSVMLTSTVSEKRKARKNVHEKVLDPFIFACHYMTDCTNWKTVSRVRDCTVTVACTALGVKAFPERLSGPLMKVLPAKQVLPLIGAAAGKPFRNATITAFAAAAASYSEGLVSAPLIRETVSLGTKIGDGLKATAHVAETIVAMGLNTSVSSFAMASSGAVTVASEAASSAAKYAGTASRGAVKAFGLGMRKSSSGVSLPRLSKSARVAIGRPLAVSLTQRQS